MNTIREEVDLPDPAIQLLVHPLDLPVARRSFAASWWLEQLASPTMFLALASMLWAISNNYITPILASLVITVCAAFASRYQSGEAWSHIPRKRHDHKRQVPLSWSVTQAAISTLALYLGLILLLGWIIARDFPPGVAAYSVGVGIGIVLIMSVTLLWDLAAPRHLRSVVGARYPQYVSLALIAAAVVYSSVTLSGAAAAEGLQMTDIATGVAVILAVQALWLLIRVISRPVSEPEV